MWGPGPMEVSGVSARTAHDYRGHGGQDQDGDQAGELAAVALDERGNQALVVVAAVEEGVQHRDGEDASARPSRNTPIMTRTIAQTMSKVTSAPVSRPDGEVADEVQWHVEQGERHRGQQGCLDQAVRVLESGLHHAAHAASSQMLIRSRLTSRPTSWPATKGPMSTGVKVSPRSSANVRVNPGSPARTRTHHRAPIRHRTSGGPVSGRRRRRRWPR